MTNLLYLNNESFSDYYTLDIEADSLNPTKIYCVCVEDIHTGEMHDFYGENLFEELKKFMAERPNAKYVGHNIISFDIYWLAKLGNIKFNIDRIVDTMVLSYLFDPYIPGGHSLDAWGKRLKCGKIDFNDWSGFSKEMLIYCQQDVRLTTKVYKALRNKMKGMGYSELSCEIEHKVRYVTDFQQRKGVYFDIDFAERLLDDLTGKLKETEKEIRKLFPPKLVKVKDYEFKRKKDGTPYSSYLSHLSKYPKITFNESQTRYACWEYQEFNIGSYLQLTSRLLELGWEPKEFTPKGGPKVSEDQLIELAESSNHPEIQKITDWKVYNARIKALQEWLGEVRRDDSRIHGSIITCGARTRRMRHYKPNTANITSVKKPFGKELRSLWRVPEGKVMVGVDAKGLEGRVLMHYLNNPEATKLFMGEDDDNDVHQMNADSISKALGIEKSRQDAKTDYYAFLYGATDKKLGSINKTNAKGGAKVRDAIMKNVPGLQRLTTEIQMEFYQGKGRLKTIDGGYVICLSPHAALNYKCQSAGGILMKLAKTLLWNSMDKSKSAIVLDVHDEWQAECDPEYADEWGQLACDSITKAGNILGFNIKMEGEYKKGNNWKDTH